MIRCGRRDLQQQQQQSLRGELAGGVGEKHKKRGTREKCGDEGSAVASAGKDGTRFGKKKKLVIMTPNP